MKTSLIALAVILSSFAFSQSSLAQTTTTVSMQTVGVQIHIPCVNAAKGGDTVNLVGNNIRVVMNYTKANGTETGILTYAGTFTGKGGSTGHTYQAEGSVEHAFTNFVPFNSDGSPNGDGNFVYTYVLHLTDQFYKDNGVLVHLVSRFVLTNDGNNATVQPDQVVCK